MAVLLQIKNAHKSYGDQVLLDGAEATIVDDLKVGFVGRNGAGKSTLLRVLIGEEELDVGEVSRHPKLRLGYLRQHDPFQPGESALEFLIRDSGQPDWRCGEVAGQFELKGAYLDGPVSKLSGGWQTRVKLAALLLHDPNLLLLDEPTNFLDLRTQILLEHFLRNFQEACLIVSHDRAFLSATCTHTLDLTRGRLTMFPGPIEAFLEYQAERRLHEERTNTAVLAKRKQLQEFIDKNKARASTATRARSKSKQLEKLELVEVESDEPTANIRAPQVEPRKGPALRCRGLTIGYPERAVAADIDVEIEHGSRAAIVGDNGQGKTTFLRTVVESLQPLAGEARWGYGCQVGVYAQHVYTSLPPGQTVLEYLEYNAAPGTKIQTILDIAAALLFRGEAVKKRVPVLSGGERARLCLAGLLLSQYNVLVLDEPGNHLDVETVDGLAQALIDYKGTVVFTSHDRHFMHRVATCVVEVRDGHVTNYRGDYDSYLYAVNKEIDEGEREAGRTPTKAAPGKAAFAKGAHPAAAKAGAPKAGPSKADTAKPGTAKADHAKSPRGGKPGGAPTDKPPAVDTRPGGRDERAMRKTLANTEKAIARLDEEKRSINSRLLAATDPDEALKLHHELAELARQLAEAERRWCQQQEELGGH